MIKITDIDIVLLTSPYRTPDRMRSYGVVVVTTEDGRRGVGEPYAAVNLPTVCREAIKSLRPLLVGHDAENFSPTLAYAQQVVEYFDHRGMIASLLGAVDWALHDLAAQRAGLPLHRFLNPHSSDSVELYASTGLVTLTHDQLRQELDLRIEQGYRTIKIRIGCGLQTPQEAIARTTLAARHLENRARLGADAGQQIFVQNRWPIADALQVNDALGDLHLLFYEDPYLITDRSAYRALKSMNRAPIAGGEMFNDPADFEDYFTAGALDIAQPDACVLPGPAATLSVIESARRRGLPAFLHGWAGPVAQMQNIHAALAAEGCDLVEFCPLLHPLLTDGLAPVWDFQNGRLKAPAATGMGCLPIEVLAKKYPFTGLCSLIA